MKEELAIAIIVAMLNTDSGVDDLVSKIAKLTRYKITKKTEEELIPAREHLNAVNLAVANMAHPKCTVFSVDMLPDDNRTTVTINDCLDLTLPGLKEKLEAEAKEEKRKHDAKLKRAAKKILNKFFDKLKEQPTND